nr:hypothetical protein [Tanacetum cinerariifolium]
MADVNAPSGQAPAMAPPVRPLQLPPPFHQSTSSSSGIRYNMTRKLEATDPILGYLKFSAKGTKREVFGMPIPGSLITADIQAASYYQEYLAHVAKHRRYLADETGSVQASPAPKPTKPARKPKSTAPKAPPRPAVSTPVTSAQPAPTSAPAKSQEKKRKQAIETSDKPPKAKKSKYGVIGKKRSLKFMAASEAEDVPVMEHQVAAEDTDLQKALEESMKIAYALSRGPLPLVVIREPDPRRKALQINIFQRHVSEPTGSSKHDESPNVVLGQSDSKEESEKVVLGSDEGDEGCTATAYPRVQENLKLTVEEHVLLEDPASSSGTLSSLQHLSKDISFGDLFFSDKPSDADKNAETKVKSMRMWETESYKTYEDHMQLFEALEKSMNRDHSEELTQDLVEAPGPSGASRDPGASGSSQVPPPPPPPSSTNQESPSKGSTAPSSLKTAASAEYQAWTTTDIRLGPSISLTPADLEMDADMAPDEQSQLSDDEDIGSAHIPKVNLMQDWWKSLEKERPATPEPAWSIPSSNAPVPPNNWASALASNYSPPPEDSLLAQTSDIAIFIDWFYKRRGITELKPQDMEGPTFEIVKVFHPDVIHLQYQIEECHKLLTDSVDDSILRNNVSKPLPLGGPPGQVTIQYDFFFNKDLEYLRYGSKGSRPTLSISKIKAAYYPDVGLKQMVPDQFWIDEECKYDIAAMYGISHWWFQRQRFYIDRHTSKVLRRADLNEHVIVERGFKYLYPSDFEDLYLLNLQGHLNHLPPKDKKILSTATQLNLTKPQWDAKGLEYKHDYTVIDSPRAVMFQDKYEVQMMMRFNNIHKFSDGTLQQIDEALDYRVKEFRINRMNPGLNTRFWTRKDVDRCKAFMFTIQRHLRTRRIFRNLESFVGGRVREGDYRLLKRTK